MTIDIESIPAPIMIDGDGRVSTLDTSSLPVHDALEGMLRDMELEGVAGDEGDEG